ncbi:hypothetical protein [Sporosarcina sp. HYO08]|uniref:hypothetical protein n=1 Tax=Sporosarcina sp. HYO08 TaxID=1759557 RepID=UPI000791C0A0|nr:hypothetical protein [Sporosarcina sp. HYO08]KXH84076.1 hypothetical protein AU377_04815 [Sporosarcina sp. HYO08]
MNKVKGRLRVLSIQETYLDIVADQLEDIFGDQIEVLGTTLQELTMETITEGEMVVLSKDILKGITSPFIPESCQVIVAKREVNVAGTREIANVPIGQKILVINDTYEHACEAAESLKQIFYGQEYIAYNPIHAIPDQIDHIVTPGECESVPGQFLNVIDIGPRTLDFNTVLEVSKQLDLLYDQRSLMNRFFKSQITLADRHRFEMTNEQKGQLVMDQVSQYPKAAHLSEQEIDEIGEKIEEHGFLEESLAILAIYEEGKRNFKSFGRVKVKVKLLEKDIRLSDQQLRLRLEVMQELGLVHARQGRGGTKLLERGEEFLHYHMNR